MTIAPLFAALFSVLIPTRMWYPPTQPDEVQVKASGDATLVLTDFEGKKLNPSGPADVNGEKTVDVKSIFPQLASVGTYVLYSVPKGKSLAEFEGTPLVIEVRGQKQEGMPNRVQVTRVLPLQYAVMQTGHGPLTMVFYYDVAPLTSESFLTLASQGYFDKLTFHRIVPGFVIQGGDPTGTGNGGPGYNLPAEFNDRPHLPGVLSMARTDDPNSGGSQFFVCLDYERTKHLDHKYTAFGKVVGGMDAVNKIAHAPIANEETGAPAQPQVIENVTIKPVTAKENPYAEMLHLKGQ